jgi:uncharacterized protein (AIM24 family)
MKKLLAIALGVALAGLGTVALASRNPAGTMSVPALNPVTSGSTITIAWANGTISDISAELTDSLSRSGKGGMLAPIRTTDGTIAAPAHAFTSEPGLGFYRSAAGVGNFVSGGSNALIWSSTSVNTPLDMSFSKGSTQALTKSNAGNFQITNSVAGGNVVITAGSGGYIVAGSNVAMGNLLITNLRDPVSAQDATTVAYTNSLITTRIEPTAAALSWTALTVGGANCGSGANSPGFTKFQGVVYLRGAVTGTGGTCSAPTVTGLTSGNFPGTTRVFAACSITNAGVFACVTNATTGITVPLLDGISFPAEG